MLASNDLFRVERAFFKGFHRELKKKYDSISTLAVVNDINSAK